MAQGYFDKKKLIKKLENKSQSEKIVIIQECLLAATKQNNLLAVASLQRMLEEEIQQTQKTSLANVAMELSVDEHYEAICRMVRMFVFADLLYGAAVDFKGYLRKVGIVDIPIASKAEAIGESCRQITAEIDGFKDNYLSDSFAELCDKCNMMLMNEIYRHEAKLKPKIKKQHEENDKKK